MGVREDRYRVSVTLDGAGVAGVWDKVSGGDVDSDETIYKPGGMAAPVSLGGTVSYSSVTVSRLYDHAAFKALVARAGKGRVTVTKIPLDADGNAYAGQSIVYSGTLKTVKAPDADSGSSKEAMIEIQVTCDQVQTS